MPASRLPQVLARCRSRRGRSCAPASWLHTSTPCTAGNLCLKRPLMNVICPWPLAHVGISCSIKRFHCAVKSTLLRSSLQKHNDEATYIRRRFSMEASVCYVNCSLITLTSSFGKRKLVRAEQGSVVTELARRPLNRKHHFLVVAKTNASGLCRLQCNASLSNGTARGSTSYDRWKFRRNVTHEGAFIVSSCMMHTLTFLVR